ncbi:MFS transporter [Shewanella chilikensis]|uniref:MFS transporter n=1 Tax=Shewanella chilikensis TaxID=558541 RepID=UPI00399AC485
MPLNVWVLMLAQAFAMSATPIMVLLGGIIGAELSPVPSLSTLPIAMMVVGVAVAIVPINILMQRFGRRRVFIGGALLTSVAGVMAALSVWYAQFWGFCASGLLLGCGGAIIQQYRFAAMESVAPTLSAKAASRVLLGGLLAAFLGPELALLAKDILPVTYSGAFLMVTLVGVLALACLLFYQDEGPVLKASKVERMGIRPLPIILRQSRLWVACGAAVIGYALMSFIMTATPVHMHNIEHHSLEDTKWVIQSHVIAMYLPSLISGYLIARLGHTRIMLAGLALYCLTLALALAGRDLLNYWSALVMLGVGWNFLFVAGTSLLPGCYRPEERFTVQSFNDSLVFGSQALASLGAGWVIYQLGWQLLLVICIPAIATQLILIAWWKLSKSKALQITEP